MSDPYQPPSADLQQPSVGPLYTPLAVVVATVLGSLAAGVVLLILNYRTLKKPVLAQKTATWGGIAYVVLIGTATLLPDIAVLGLLFMAIQAVAAYFVADRLQGAVVRYHVAHGTKECSLLRAAGVGLLTAVALLGVLLIVGTVFAILSLNGSA